MVEFHGEESLATIELHQRVLLFFGWQCIKLRLATTDKIQVWNLQCSLTSFLYGVVNESIEHLLFACNYSATIWYASKDVLNVSNPRNGFQHGIENGLKESSQ